MGLYPRFYFFCPIQIMMWLGSLGIIVYVIGIPLLIGMVLKFGKSKRLFNDLQFRARFGWSYIRFEDNKWWWQIVWLAKRLFFVLVAVFVRNGVVQGLLAMTFVVVFCLLHFYARPFDHDYLDVLEGLLLGNTFIFILAGVYFSSQAYDSELGAYSHQILVTSVVIFALCCVQMVVGVVVNFSHFFQMKFVSSILRRREGDFNHSSTGQAKGFLLQRLSQGNLLTEGLMMDNEKDKAVRSVKAGGMSRVRMLAKTRLDEQLFSFADLFFPTVLVKWGKDPSSDFAAFRDIAVLSEMFSSSSYHADRDLFEANREFFEKLSKSMPELIDWLAITMKATAIAKVAEQRKDHLIVRKEGTQAKDNVLRPAVSDVELAQRQQLCDSLEAMRKAWVDIRLVHYKEQREKKLLARLGFDTEPIGFCLHPSNTRHTRVSTRVGAEDTEGGAGSGEAARYGGRLFEAFMPETRQFILHMLVQAYVAGEGPPVVQRFARFVSHL
uniref:Uncharacterized protein n=1 Tax=Palpitomonas bilix TaxID=652834 RepID=A0A7S3G4R8_9EUKA|mmetsp:Transcript_25652/g.64475  ORF Transcript_25652/g.64475 Transcript_25652/m.64475 type:complete len:495 (+) Transcript_25652:2138-3622(+)